MNPFEYFQQMRPQIERDEAIMGNFGLYAFSNAKSLVHLGIGKSHTHYRIGKIGDLWIATRELFNYKEEPETQMVDCERYIDWLVRTYDDGKGVPVIVGGVKAISPADRVRYFLMLQDLTSGRSGSFIPALDGKTEGTVDGRRVTHDSPKRPLTDLEGYLEDTGLSHLEYMVDGKMIQLVE